MKISFLWSQLQKYFRSSAKIFQKGISENQIFKYVSISYGRAPCQLSPIFQTFYIKIFILIIKGEMKPIGTYNWSANFKTVYLVYWTEFGGDCFKFLCSINSLSFFTFHQRPITIACANDSLMKTSFLYQNSFEVNLDLRRFRQ